MELTVINEDLSPIKRSLLEHLVFDILDELSVDGELSIYFVDSAEMQTLNKRYRGKDYDTDVLSFEFKGVMPAEYDIFGDIIISNDFSRKSAKDKNITHEEEVLELIIHGILHLLGYEHENVHYDVATKMFEKQAYLLNKFKGLL